MSGRKGYYTLTTINIQGDDQEAFEVYADESKEQSIGFVFDKRQVDALLDHESLKRQLDVAIGLLHDASVLVVHVPGGAPNFLEDVDAFLNRSCAPVDERENPMLDECKSALDFGVVKESDTL